MTGYGDNIPHSTKAGLTPREREELILEHTPLIKYVAGRIAMRLPSHIYLDDLMSAGVLGLIDAVDKYDPGKKVQFKTYAEFRIRGAILDELRSMDWVPRSVRKKSTQLEDTYNRLQNQLGRPASDEEVAEELGIGLEEFHRLLDEVKGVNLLSMDDQDSPLAHLDSEQVLKALGKDESEDPLLMLGLAELRQQVAKAIAGLPEKEKLVVSLYYYDELTMREIGEVLGYTESRISQMHTKAILRLRARLRMVVAS
ncbi:FliA/WhiG family RNA polymerase sigma factor [Dethiosulfatarculus sandiegensis]|uniref:RNA polymerase sigma factor n=1 Tax=Dethiosulfatarculus sandiegensis TaxID=1429043 RepID=A0A0D2J609_9BACT|nr:FliA/WhiG family RNA polymerase sigma factor [Dethiosulfatarculus sandiegensis]KIX13524.1 RNA polymerase sigma factor [Dethiosulfatarculus sandiegensis]